MSEELEHSLNTVAKGAGIVFIGMFIGNLLGIFNQMLLGRFLGVAQYGLFSLSLSIVSLLATFSVFGLFAALPRFIPFHLGKGEKDVVKSSIDFSLIFVLCISTFISFFIFLFAKNIAVDIFHDAQLEFPLRLFIICLPFIAISNIFQAIIQSFKAVTYRLLIYDVGIRISKMAVFIPLILAGYMLFGAIFAYLVATIFTIVVSFLVIRRKLFVDHRQYKKVHIARQLLSFAWPLSLTGITFLFISQTDVLLIGYYLSSVDVGIYVPALTIARFLTFVGSAFGYIFLPVVSGLFAKRKASDIKSLFKSTSKWMFVLVFPMFLFLVLFPKEVITILYSNEFAGGYFVLAILAFGVFSNVFTGMTGSILIGSGRPRLNLICEIVAAVTNVSLNLLLIPLYGILGAAIATSISYLSRNFMSLIFVYKTNGMQPYTRKYLGILISGVVGLFVVFGVKSYLSFPLPLLVMLILFGILLLVVYIPLIILLRCLDKNDVFVFRSITNRLGIKMKFFDRLL